MLSSFNLDEDQNLEEIRTALAKFVEEMQRVTLVDSAGPVLIRSATLKLRIGSI